MAEELVKQKSILLDSLAILERSAVCGPEVILTEEPEVWEKQLNEVYNRYFDIVARLEVMTSANLKLERMEFDGKYYALSAHILNSLVLPPLPTLPCNAAAQPHGGFSTVASQAISSPLPAQHSSSSESTPTSSVPVTPKPEAQPTSGSSTALPTRKSTRRHRKPKHSTPAVPKQAVPASSGYSATGITSNVTLSIRAKPPMQSAAPKQTVPAQASSRSRPSTKPVAPTVTAEAKPASSSSAVIPRDGKLTKPCAKRGSDHLRLSPDIRKPLSHGTDPVSRTSSNPSYLRSHNQSSYECSGTHCRSCSEKHYSLPHANQSQPVPSMPSRKQRQVSRQSRSASRPHVHPEHYARCLLNNAPRVLPRAFPNCEELLLQLTNNLHYATHSYTIKLPHKHIAERAQLGHVREVDCAKVDALLQCVLTHTQANSAPTLSAGFEDSCRSESDFLEETPGHSIQVNPTTISCTSFQPLPVCADMFRQILVRPSGQLFPRIWWRDSLPMKAFELQTVAHGVSNAAPSSPTKESYHTPLAVPVPRRESTEDRRIVADKDSPLNVPCEPASAGFQVRRRTMELRETSLLRDLTPNPTVAAVGLHMAGYELLKLSIWTIQIDKTPPVPNGTARDCQKLTRDFCSAHQFRNLTRQIIRNRRFRHLGRIGPPRLSESHPRQAYRPRKHGSSMAAGQHTQ